MVNGFLSDFVHVISGVPQGSVLGPLLFLILISDIDKDVLHSFLSSFADDTRVGRSIKTEDDVKKLQVDLDKIYQWAIDNNMDFNNNKFELIRYGLDLLIKILPFIPRKIALLKSDLFSCRIFDRHFSTLFYPSSLRS